MIGGRLQSGQLLGQRNVNVVVMALEGRRIGGGFVDDKHLGHEGAPSLM